MHRPLWQKVVVIGSQGPSNQSAAANPEPFRDVTTDFALMKQTRLLAEYRIQGRRLAPLTLMMVALCAIDPTGREDFDQPCPPLRHPSPHRREGARRC